MPHQTTPRWPSRRRFSVGVGPRVGGWGSGVDAGLGAFGQYEGASNFAYRLEVGANTLGAPAADVELSGWLATGRASLGAADRVAAEAVG